jgi:hypothetical protein
MHPLYTLYALLGRRLKERIDEEFRRNPTKGGEGNFKIVSRLVEGAIRRQVLHYALIIDCTTIHCTPGGGRNTTAGTAL